MISNGIDITYIKRFEELKTDERFMNKVFTSDEREYIKSHNNTTQTIAGIYAAKEAFLKSLKKGINNYALTDIEIKHGNNKEPYIILHNSLSNLEYTSISISISHDNDYAIASCVILL